MALLQNLSGDGQSLRSKVLELIAGRTLGSKSLKASAAGQKPGTSDGGEPGSAAESASSLPALTDDAERGAVNMSRAPSGSRLADVNQPSQPVGKRKAESLENSRRPSSYDAHHRARRRRIDNSLYLESSTGGVKLLKDASAFRFTRKKTDGKDIAESEYSSASQIKAFRFHWTTPRKRRLASAEAAADLEDWAQDDPANPASSTPKIDALPAFQSPQADSVVALQSPQAFAANAQPNDAGGSGSAAAGSAIKEQRSRKSGLRKGPSTTNLSSLSAAATSGFSARPEAASASAPTFSFGNSSGLSSLEPSGSKMTQAQALLNSPLEKPEVAPTDISNPPAEQIKQPSPAATFAFSAVGQPPQPLAKTANVQEAGGSEFKSSSAPAFGGAASGIAFGRQQAADADKAAEAVQKPSLRAEPALKGGTPHPLQPTQRSGGVAEPNPLVNATAAATGSSVTGFGAGLSFGSTLGGHVPSSGGSGTSTASKIQAGAFTFGSGSASSSGPATGAPLTFGGGSTAPSAPSNPFATNSASVSGIKVTQQQPFGNSAFGPSAQATGGSAASPFGGGGSIPAFGASASTALGFGASAPSQPLPSSSPQSSSSLFGGSGGQATGAFTFGSAAQGSGSTQTAGFMFGSGAHLTSQPASFAFGSTAGSLNTGAPAFGAASAPSIGGGSTPAFGSGSASSFGGGSAPAFGGGTSSAFGGGSSPSAFAFGNAAGGAFGQPGSSGQAMAAHGAFSFGTSQGAQTAPAMAAPAFAFSNSGLMPSSGMTMGGSGASQVAHRTIRHKARVRK